MNEKVDFETLDFVVRCCRGWIKCFNSARDILREMEARKIIPHDLFLKVHKLVEMNKLPKKYYKKGARNAD